MTDTVTLIGTGFLLLISQQWVMITAGIVCSIGLVGLAYHSIYGDEG